MDVLGTVEALIIDYRRRELFLDARAPVRTRVAGIHNPGEGVLGRRRQKFGGEKKGGRLLRRLCRSRSACAERCSFFVRSKLYLDAHADARPIFVAFQYPYWIGCSATS